MLSRLFSRFQFLNVRNLRAVSGSGPPSGEAILSDLLRQRFPHAKTIEVRDISGGCGAMYEIFLEAAEFRGLNTVKQHRLVTETLKAQIKEMHGLRIHTEVAS